MQKSPTILGKGIGLNGQQMYWLLKDQGYVSGVPGDYSLTDLARPYAVIKGFHDGPGGYYNGYHEELTLDDSIMEKLDLSEEAITRALDGLAAYRAAKRLSKKLAEKAEENAQRLAEEAAEHKDEILKWIGWGTAAAVCAGLGYGIYRWRKKKEAEAEKNMNANEEE